MRTSYDLDGDAGLKGFGDIVMDVSNANFGAIAKSQMQIAIIEASHCAAVDLLADYPDAVTVHAIEGKTGFEMGLIFHMKDITALADLLMMGDGTPKQTLSDELKDAGMEMSNQFFGALVVPVEQKLGKKFQFKVESIVQGPKDMQSDAFVVYEMGGSFNGVLQYRMFVDESFSVTLGGGGKPQGAQGSDVFNTNFFDAPMADKPTSGPTSPNMEMLLDIEIPISVRMGSAKLFLKDILGLGPGNIVELDQNADEPIELTVNDKLVARGEVVIVDGYFGFRIKEIISKAERIKRLKD